MSSILCLRKKAGLSQQYIADHLGISQGAVSQWERGMTMPSADKLPLLAKLLGCTTDELLEPSKRRAGKGGKYMAKNLKYFRKLKTLMFDKEVDQKYIAEKAGKSIGYISNRFQGKQPFSMDDVYTIIEILEIPQEEALTYFPKGGISEKKGAKTA